MKKNFHKNMLITGACLALLFGGIVNVRAIAPEEYEAVQQSRTIKGTVCLLYTSIIFGVYQAEKKWKSKTCI